jgi:hypothetical protein
VTDVFGIMLDLCSIEVEMTASADDITCVFVPAFGAFSELL